MRKEQLRQWPHNNQPSPLHQWWEVRTATQTGGGHVAHCERCGSHFIERADTRGPVYCYPSAAWLAAHPADDDALGVNGSGQRCGEYGRVMVQTNA